ncbi:MAG: hypothetical protein JHC31_07970 [Sulfurihydrogenibium sp.]|jgi:hypothetical protein|nr:hypothetical protein [Sulfurihydrogenibium sp.]
MLVQIRKFLIAISFFLFLNDFSYAVNIVPLPNTNLTGYFQYSGDFISKAKYVAALIYSYYMYQNDFNDVYIPVKVKYKTYYDLLLFGIKTKNAYTWTGYCYNDPDNGVYLSYYMYSNMAGVVGMVPDRYADNITMWCADQNFPLTQPTSWSQVFPVPGSLQVNGQWFGPNNTRVPVSESFSLYSSVNYPYQIRDFFVQSIGDVSTKVDKPVLASIDLDARNSYFSASNISTNNLVSNDYINSGWQYPENTYLSNGYLEASDSDVISSGTATNISSGSFVYTKPVINGSTISINVNVDLSTITQKLSDIYDFMRSTYVDQSDLDVVSNSINQATSSVHSIFSHFQSFFHTTSNDVWDCSVDFSSINVLGYDMKLGKFNLCDRWGWVFDLLKKMLQFSALVTAFYIIGSVG